jgi:hypothetical protein
MSRTINVNQNYSINAGDGLVISFLYGNRGPFVWTRRPGDPSLPNLPGCYDKIANNPAVDLEGHPRLGYLPYSSRVDGNGNTIQIFCPGYYGVTPIDISNWCVILLMEFTSTAGPSTEDPNKMYFVGKQSTVKYSTGISQIPSLYTIDTSNSANGRVTFIFTSIGTSTYQTNVNKSNHALGATIGERSDAYGMTFSTANYEVWGISHNAAGSVKFLYGSIQITGGLVGGDISCT